MVRGALAALAGGAAPRVFAQIASGERPALLARALAALDAHAGRIAHRDVLGLVDFAAPSRAQRFALVDLIGGRVRETHLVAHGRGSDPANLGWVQHFSNRPGSDASSPGAFRTGETYWGQHGHARRLDGLEADNSRARERDIVLHGADYVTPAIVRAQGRCGRSQGCFAVSPRSIEDVLAALGEGRLLFAGK